MFVRVLVVAYDRSPSAGLRFEVMLGYVLNVSTGVLKQSFHLNA